MLSLKELHTRINGKKNQEEKNGQKEQKWTPLNRRCPLFQLFLKRMREGRDLRIIVTANNSETGTGKTTCALWLAMSFDPEWTPEKAALDPITYAKKYRILKPGSVLLFDECHQVDNRRSMKDLNIDLSKIWMTMRVRQICTIFTTPTMTVVDKRLKELADVRVHVMKRGLAHVYRILVNQFDGSLWEEELLAIEFPNLDWHPYKKELDRMKEKLIDDIIEQISLGKVTEEEWYRIGKEVHETKKQYLAKGMDESQAMKASIVHVCSCYYDISDATLDLVKSYYERYLDATAELYR